MMWVGIEIGAARMVVRVFWNLEGSAVFFFLILFFWTLKEFTNLNFKQIIVQRLLLFESS